jgi:hypothetical protein
MSTNNFDESSGATPMASSIDQIVNPSQPDESVLATNLVSQIRKRGITLRVVRNRLRVSPWTALSSEHQVALREHRQAIKAIVAAAGGTMPGLPQPAPEPPRPEPVIDLDAQLKARDIDTWRVIHGRDPEEIDRRRRAATEQMVRHRINDETWSKVYGGISSTRSTA